MHHCGPWGVLIGDPGYESLDCCSESSEADYELPVQAPALCWVEGLGEVRCGHRKRSRSRAPQNRLLSMSIGRRDTVVVSGLYAFDQSAPAAATRHSFDHDQLIGQRPKIGCVVEVRLWPQDRHWRHLIGPARDRVASQMCWCPLPAVLPVCQRRIGSEQRAFNLVETRR